MDKLFFLWKIILTIDNHQKFKNHQNGFLEIVIMCRIESRDNFFKMGWQIIKFTKLKMGFYATVFRSDFTVGTLHEEIMSILTKRIYTKISQKNFMHRHHCEKLHGW